MKKVLFILVCIFTIAFAYANEKFIESFKVTNNSNVVNIEWTTSAEVGISHFEIERSTTSGFKTIYVQKANNKASSYKYTDSDSFTKETYQNDLQASNTATYRLKTVFSNTANASYSDEIIVTRNMSSIKRTLGMLKEMFK